VFVVSSIFDILRETFSWVPLWRGVEANRTFPSTPRAGLFSLSLSLCVVMVTMIRYSADFDLTINGTYVTDRLQVHLTMTSYNEVLQQTSRGVSLTSTTTKGNRCISSCRHNARNTADIALTADYDDDYSYYNDDDVDHEITTNHQGSDDTKANNKAVGHNIDIDNVNCGHNAGRDDSNNDINTS
jgi:hypothetical protein